VKSFAELGEELARLSIEIARTMQQAPPAEAHGTRAARSAFALVERASIGLMLVDERALEDKVKALDDRCRCGWDRGSHMVAPPHLCEEDDRCPGFTIAVADTLPPPAPSSPTLIDCWGE
jgi:hypothetical protein